MSTKPILFKPEMVTAILKGRKTQTRRVIKWTKKIEKPQIGFTAFCGDREFAVRGYHENGTYGESLFKMKYCKGDILWVREPVKIDSHQQLKSVYDWQVDYTYISDDKNIKSFLLPHRITTSHINALIYPEELNSWISKHQRIPNGCLKEMARIFLKVTKVRVERLQDISEEDAIAEGVDLVYFDTYRNYLDSASKSGCDTAKESFKTLWQSINSKKEGYTWKDNPFLFVYDFKITEEPKDFLNS